MGGLDFSIFFDRLIKPPVLFVGNLLLYAFVISLAFFVYCMMKYRFPLRFKGKTVFHTAVTILRLKYVYIKLKPFDFMRWLIIDSMYKKREKDVFKPFGLTLYCGRQGSGKTVSMINYANYVRARYPKCIIVSNFSYNYADKRMTGWRDFMEIRNGEDGVLFLIDEIHSEYSSKAWKDFPEELLSEVSQQRKQRIKICATSQIYSRVVKPLREQTFSVVQCSTIGGRWTFNKEYDAKDYEIWCETGGKKHLKPMSRTSFVQSDMLRQCYDTYEKIERLSKMEFIDRHER